MDVETKLGLIKDFAKEIITERELRKVFEEKNRPVVYDGFEPSGIAPIHFGLLRATNLKNMLKAGVRFKLYLADYFAFINNKLGGNMENIKNAGKYFIEVWKACGIDTKKVDIIWASELMDRLEYWDRVLTVARETSFNRTKKSLTIAGRKEDAKITTAQLFYPSMQVADIFELDVDICQLGMDQRRANMLARDIAKKMKWKSPAVVHHHMILGLQGLQKKATEEETLLSSKMSKSDPKSCIYMHDDFDTIKKKINSAFCPEKQEQGNPLLEYCKHIIFREAGSMSIERKEKFGGDITFENYEELKKAYIKGSLHPADLKNGVANELEKLIKPVREHFETDKTAKALYDSVKRFKITK